jgi:hypothetical protein
MSVEQPWVQILNFFQILSLLQHAWSDRWAGVVVLGLSYWSIKPDKLNKAQIKRLKSFAIVFERRSVLEGTVHAWSGNQLVNLLVPDISTIPMH